MAKAVTGKAGTTVSLSGFDELEQTLKALSNVRVRDNIMKA